MRCFSSHLWVPLHLCFDSYALLYSRLRCLCTTGGGRARREREGARAAGRDRRASAAAEDRRHGGARPPARAEATGAPRSLFLLLSPMPSLLPRFLPSSIRACIRFASRLLFFLFFFILPSSHAALLHLQDLYNQFKARQAAEAEAAQAHAPPSAAPAPPSAALSSAPAPAPSAASAATASHSAPAKVAPEVRYFCRVRRCADTLHCSSCLSRHPPACRWCASRCRTRLSSVR